MRLSRLPLASLIIATLSGCGYQESAAGPKPPNGRYIGVGIYDAGELWRQIKSEGPVTGKASRDDDDRIIVVVDIRTGEVRQCGNMSGRCVSANPWSQSIEPQEKLPAALLKNAAQLASELQSEATETQEELPPK